LALTGPIKAPTSPLHATIAKEDQEESKKKIDRTTGQGTKGDEGPWVLIAETVNL
jgi:hypothetical protein